jgi:hypothetical protein
MSINIGDVVCIAAGSLVATAISAWKVSHFMNLKRLNERKLNENFILMSLHDVLI